MAESRMSRAEHEKMDLEEKLNQCQEEKRHIAGAVDKDRRDAQVALNRLHGLNYALEGNLPINFDADLTIKIKEEAIQSLEEQLKDLRVQYTLSEMERSKLNAANDKLIGALKEKVAFQDSQLATAKERTGLYSANNDALWKHVQNIGAGDHQVLLSATSHQI